MKQEGFSGYPWLTVIVFEWALNLDSKAKKIASPKDIRKIVNRLIGMQTSEGFKPEDGGIDGWLRRISYQQFIYQRVLTSYDIALQALLFEDLPTNSVLAGKFKLENGCTLNNFQTLSIGLFTFVETNKSRIIKEGDFRILGNFIPDEEIRAFLNALYYNKSELKSLLAELYDKNPFQISKREYHRQSLFFKKPLILIDQSPNFDGLEYAYLHRSHIEESIKEFCYYSLRKIDPQGFMDEFGRVFERYVKRLLEETSLIFHSEKAMIKGHSGNKPSMVDFVVEYENSLVFIEAKGTDTSPQIESFRGHEELQNGLKNSVVKGLRQGQKAADLLGQQRGFKNKKIYQIIVTYKQHYLSTERFMKSCLGEDFIESIVPPNSGLLPLKRIIVMDIQEFEILIGGVIKSSISMTEFLDSVIEAERLGAPNQKLTALLYLQDFGCDTPPQFLKNRADTIFDAIIEEFPAPSDSEKITG